MLNNFFKFSKDQQKRIKGNFFSQFSSASIQSVIQLFFPPLMIIVWGVDNFGVWIFLISIPATLAIFNFNFTEAAKIEMTIFHTKKKIKEVQEIFQNSIALVIVSILIFSIIVFFVFFFLKLNFASIKNLPLSDLKIILFFVILSFYFNICNSILINGIVFWGKIHIVINIGIIFDLITKAAIIFTGIFSNSLVYAALVFFIFNLMMSVVYYYYFIKNKKYLILSLTNASIKTTIKLFKLSLSYSIESLANILKHNGQIVIFGAFFSSSLIAYISTCKTLFYFFPIRFFSCLNLISYFEYAQTFARDKLSELKYNYKKHIIITLGLILLFLVGSIVLGPIVYELWLGNTFELSFVLLLLIVSEVSLICLKNTIIVSMRSLNKFFKISIIELLLLTIATCFSYYFLHLGYSFISYFVIILISTILFFLISSYMAMKFYQKL